MGAVQDNEWTIKAKECAQRTGRDPCDYLRQQRSTATGDDLIKITMAQKYMGCRNKKRVRRGTK